MPDVQTPEMQACIANCRECATICLETGRHGFELGGDAAPAGLVTTLLDCADSCRRMAALVD